MADATDLKSVCRKAVKVRVLSSAPSSRHERAWIVVRATVQAYFFSQENQTLTRLGTGEWGLVALSFELG